MIEDGREAQVSYQDHRKALHDQVAHDARFRRWSLLKAKEGPTLDGHLSRCNRPKTPGQSGRHGVVSVNVLMVEKELGEERISIVNCVYCLWKYGSSENPKTVRMVEWIANRGE